MFCGFLGILNALYGDLVSASVCVLLASVFDFLDGAVARRFKLYSEIGKQLDSFADLVSFGTLPALILHVMLIKSHHDWVYFAHVGGLPLVSLLPFALTACAAIRLGKFNLSTDQGVLFRGLPTPAVALFIAALPLIMRFNLYLLGYKSIYPDNVILNPWFILSLVFIFSWLMCSDIRIMSLKFHNFSWNDNKARYLLFALSVILFVFLLFLALPLSIILLIAFSFIFKHK